MQKHRFWRQHGAPRGRGKGAQARASNNEGSPIAFDTMDLKNLVLVAPRRYPDPQALWRSANATDILEKAVVLETLEEALSEIQFVVGTLAQGACSCSFWPGKTVLAAANRAQIRPEGVYARSQRAVLRC